MAVTQQSQVRSLGLGELPPPAGGGGLTSFIGQPGIQQRFGQPNVMELLKIIMQMRQTLGAPQGQVQVGGLQQGLLQRQRNPQQQQGTPPKRFTAGLGQQIGRSR